MLWVVLDVLRLPDDWRERLAALRAADVVDVYLLRAKTLAPARQYEYARAVGAAVRDRPWLVADRVDVALAAGASGVHLPADGLAPAVVRRIWPRALISRAIHGPEEWTPDEPDWWLFGHLFPTRSKPGLPARGLDAARQATAGSERPVLGIGGITAENAERVSRAGLAGVAVVDAVWQAPDSVGAARGIRAAFERGREAR